MSTTIWVDADSCPKPVRNYLVNYSQKLNLKIIFVANKNIPCENKHPLFSMIITDKENQAADNYIIEHVAEKDIVITRDIPLASLLVQKNIAVINDRGKRWTNENIRERKSERDFALNLSLLGLKTDGKNTYSKKEFSEFANCFDREIHRIIK
ncbi:MAG: DUF188 domain-containing protein [Treponema sp.]|nr:DUF188 domain-containing protein [Candidatus Treponema merdequi]